MAQQQAIADVVGIGAGPSNLGLAAAVHERNKAGYPSLSMAVLERKPAFAWHPGMLLDGATMQIAFLKDLVTLRNPRSPFSFLSYLEARGRLVDFINHQTFFPTRVEFTDYLGWVAESVDASISYGTTVTAVERLDGSGTPDGARWLVRFSGPDGDGELRARSVVVATGLRERLPEWAATGPRLFHNHRLLEHLAAADLDPAAPHRFLVVGGGQSAAEVAQHLHRSYPEAVVECAFNSYGFQPADDSPYANKVFDPAAVDDFFDAEDDVRAELMARHATTNYGCVDLELINELYAVEYQEKVTGNRRLLMRPVTEVRAAAPSNTGVRVELHDRMSERTTTAEYTAVVCATGFRSIGVSDVVSDWGVAPERIRVGRDYRLTIDGEPVPGLYVQGATEATHGLGSTLLSNVAVRAGEILDGLVADTSLTTIAKGA
ncbi:lysine N(6)-hydroxylase/L-ornithine N(5)-oxygenase family protein [Tsukamurella sp. PLM1]|uniref:lysine N(6)-hydroxylase/L-ornithine N(5)-oxygenase family protein n=1 Tax=Tsukamurella sp. PLM1 TaxID=2929795 RepID=UPI00206FE485|nr:SidA/IucD/PvdA family monooxygenase [Tsukamurella sp. PLM1]BDH59211.1 lysine/ornithine N-monooxygenase [Tsukamurella sp. PLM1]